MGDLSPYSKQITNNSANLAESPLQEKRDNRGDLELEALYNLKKGKNDQPLQPQLGEKPDSAASHYQNLAQKSTYGKPIKGPAGLSSIASGKIRPHSNQALKDADQSDFSENQLQRNMSEQQAQHQAKSLRQESDKQVSRKQPMTSVYDDKQQSLCSQKIDSSLFGRQSLTVAAAGLSPQRRQSSQIHSKKHSSSSDVKQEVIKKAHTDMAAQERNFDQLKSALLNFKDHSFSKQGKMEYATSSIPHQTQHLQKGFEETIKEHQRTLTVEKLEVIHVNDSNDDRNRSLSKVTQGRMTQRLLKKELQGEKSPCLSRASMTHKSASKAKIELGKATLSPNPSIESQLNQQKKKSFQPYKAEVSRQSGVDSRQATQLTQTNREDSLRQLDTQKSAPLLTMRVQHAKLRSQLERTQEKQLAAENQDYVNIKNDSAQSLTKAAASGMRYKAQGGQNMRSQLKSGKREFRSPLTISSRQRCASSIPISSKSKDQNNYEKTESKSTLVFMTREQDFERIRPVVVPVKASPVAKKLSTKPEKRTRKNENSASIGGDNETNEMLSVYKNAQQSNMLSGEVYSHHHRAQVAQLDQQAAEIAYSSADFFASANQALFETALQLENLASAEMLLPSQPSNSDYALVELPANLVSHYPKQQPKASNEHERSAAPATERSQNSPPGFPDQSQQHLSYRYPPAAQNGRNQSLIGTFDGKVADLATDEHAHQSVALKKKKIGSLQRNNSTLRSQGSVAEKTPQKDSTAPRHTITQETDHPMQMQEDCPAQQRSQLEDENQDQSILMRQQVQQPRVVALPPSVACKLKLQSEIRAFQQKQRQFRNYMVLNVEPGVTSINRQRKTSKQHLHNQIRLQSLFGAQAVAHRQPKNEHNLNQPSSQNATESNNFSEPYGSKKSGYFRARKMVKKYKRAKSQEPVTQIEFQDQDMPMDTLTDQVLYTQPNKENEQKKVEMVMPSKSGSHFQQEPFGGVSMDAEYGITLQRQPPSSVSDLSDAIASPPHQVKVQFSRERSRQSQHKQNLLQSKEHQQLREPQHNSMHGSLIRENGQAFESILDLNLIEKEQSSQMTNRLMQPYLNQSTVYSYRQERSNPPSTKSQKAANNEVSNDAKQRVNDDLAAVAPYSDSQSTACLGKPSTAGATARLSGRNTQRTQRRTNKTASVLNPSAQQSQIHHDRFALTQATVRVTTYQPSQGAPQTQTTQNTNNASNSTYNVAQFKTSQQRRLLHQQLQYHQSAATNQNDAFQGELVIRPVTSHPVGVTQKSQGVVEKNEYENTATHGDPLITYDSDESNRDDDLCLEEMEYRYYIGQESTRTGNGRPFTNQVQARSMQAANLSQLRLGKSFLIGGSCIDSSPGGLQGRQTVFQKPLHVKEYGSTFQSHVQGVASTARVQSSIGNKKSPQRSTLLMARQKSQTKSSNLPQQAHLQLGRKRSASGMRRRKLPSATATDAKLAAMDSKRDSAHVQQCKMYNNFKSQKAAMFNWQNQINKHREKNAKTLAGLIQLQATASTKRDDWSFSAADTSDRSMVEGRQMTFRPKKSAHYLHRTTADKINASVLGSKPAKKDQDGSQEQRNKILHNHSSSQDLRTETDKALKTQIMTGRPPSRELISPQRRVVSRQGFTVDHLAVASRPLPGKAIEELTFVTGVTQVVDSELAYSPDGLPLKSSLQGRFLKQKVDDSYLKGQSDTTSNIVAPQNDYSSVIASPLLNIQDSPGSAAGSKATTSSKALNQQPVILEDYIMQDKAVKVDQIKTESQLSSACGHQYNNTDLKILDSKYCFIWQTSNFSVDSSQRQHQPQSTTQQPVAQEEDAAQVHLREASLLASSSEKNRGRARYQSAEEVFLMERNGKEQTTPQKTDTQLETESKIGAELLSAAQKFMLTTQGAQNDKQSTPEQKFSNYVSPSKVKIFVKNDHVSKPEHNQPVQRENKLSELPDGAKEQKTAPMSNYQKSQKSKHASQDPQAALQQPISRRLTHILNELQIQKASSSRQVQDLSAQGSRVKSFTAVRKQKKARKSTARRAQVHIDVNSAVQNDTKSASRQQGIQVQTNVISSNLSVESVQRLQPPRSLAGLMHFSDQTLQSSVSGIQANQQKIGEKNYRIKVTSRSRGLGGIQVQGCSIQRAE